MIDLNNAINKYINREIERENLRHGVPIPKPDFFVPEWFYHRLVADGWDVDDAHIFNIAGTRMDHE